MIFLSRWQKIAFIVLLFAFLSGVGTLLYARGRLAALDTGEPFFVDAPPQTPRTIEVQVSGAIQNPGTYQLVVGARAADALQAAGGPTDTADTGALNSSEILRDGTHLQVPEKTPPTTAESAAAKAPASPELISINSADADQLAQLPGIGPALAGRIIEFRTQLLNETGRGFAAKEQLLEVPGIGPKKFAEIREKICL